MVFDVIAVATVILLLVGAWVYPYVSAVILKAKMVNKLIKMADKEGFRYRRSFRSIFFTRNLSRKYDMLIYNEKKLYAVKLWSSYFAYCDLVLTRAGRIREERRSRGVFRIGQRDVLYIKSPSMRVPKLRLQKKFLSGREIERVLLVYPSYENIRAESGRGYVTLKTGDMIFDKTLYSPSAFVKRLKESGNAQTD